jgi:hypothetical protein
MTHDSILLQKYKQHLSFYKLPLDGNSKIEPVTKSGFAFGGGFDTKKKKKKKKKK